MKIKKKKISRRRFIEVSALLGGSAFFYKKWWENQGITFPKEHFIDQHNSSDSPDEVAARFVRANSPSLMTYYSIFFPPFLSSYYLDAIPKIISAKEREKSKYDKDHHRLEALPAVVAAHLLPKTIEADKEYPCHVIAKGLQDDRREVKEIIVQNLITSTAPDFDSVRYFSINEEVLAALDFFIEAAMSTPKLLSPLSLLTQFLLNARAVLRKRPDTPQTSLRALDRRLQIISDSCIPHFNYAQRLITLHNQCFPFVNPENPGSLPPQSSEIILENNEVYNKIKEPFRSYIKQIALIHARNIFSVWSTAIGKDSSALNIMSLKEAKRALPKGVSMVKHYLPKEILPRGEDASFQELPKSKDESLFKLFLENKLEDLVTNPEKNDIDLSPFDPTEEEISLSKKVPFSQYMESHLINKAGFATEKSRRGFWKNLLDYGIKVLEGGIVGGAASTFFYERLPNNWKCIKEPRPNQEEMNKIIEETVEKAKTILEHRGDSIEEQQEKIGDVIVHYKDDD